MPPRPWLPDEEIRLLTHFYFLATVPYINADDPAFANDCDICQEPYREAPLEGKSLNRPVRLRCGHVYGIQCLAHWLLSESSNLLCPHCRTPIVEASRLHMTESILTAAMVNLEIFCLFEGNFPPDKKESVLAIFERSLGMVWGNEPRDRDRLMMMWEEFLQRL